MSIDTASIEEAFRTILEALGDDVSREGLVDTPRRVAEAYRELFAGVHQDPRQELGTVFQEGHEEMVVLRDLPFYSMCEHHFLPFYGRAHVGYVPKGWVVGVNRLARVVEVLAKRPQLQERLTSQIADVIVEVLRPQGVAVVLEAEHLCMIMRGMKQRGSSVLTSAMRGVFRKNPATRAEFLALTKGQRG